MARLVLENIRKSFGDVDVINGVDLEVSTGEFVVFVGPSGCGKSTMLRMISGLESATSGRILIGDRDVTHTAPSKREIAMVFQSYALFPHMTVAENIGFGLKLARTPKPEIDRRVNEVAKTLQIEPLLARTPRQLSGGQRQRVAIGRSIIRDPKVFLFDEPLSNLDAALRVQMRLEIARLHNRLDATMIYVTHDQTEAMTLADRIVVFNAGRIEQVGTPLELYERPANTFVAGFIGAPAMNFMKGELTTANGEPAVQVGSSALPVKQLGAGQNGEAVTLGIRPEHFSITSGKKAHLSGRVELVENLGAETLAYLQTDLAKEAITIRLPPSQAVAAGDQVDIGVDLDWLHVFGQSGQTLRVQH